MLSFTYYPATSPERELGTLNRKKHNETLG